jgi:hypothetical protein
MPGTWKEFGSGSPYDPVANITAGAKFTRHNMAQLQAAGIDPTPANLYLAHQQGIGGAIKLLRNPNAPAGSVTDPKNISANNGNPNASAGEFVRQHTAKFMSLYEQHKAQLAKSSADPRLQPIIDAFTKDNPDPDAAIAQQQEAAEQQAEEDELDAVVNGAQY